MPNATVPSGGAGPPARPIVARVALATAVFFSGASSLMYQVAWTRRLTAITSATPAAQALVVAIFLAGLGLGAAWAGKRAGTLERPLRAYALVELAAAGCAAASLPALRALGIGAPAWRTGPLSALFLLATASLLGATLPFVLEHVQRNTGEGRAAGAKDRFVGLVYGTNTLGAVSGALLAGFATIERHGLRATTLIGSGIALGAVAIAAWLDAGAIPPARARTPPASSTTTPVPTPVRLVLCAGLAGTAGVGSEIVYTRLLSLIVHNTVYVFAEVLAGVLLGIAAGGFLAAIIVKRGLQSSRALSATILCLSGAAVLIAASPEIAVWLAGREGFDAGVAAGSLLSAFAVFALVGPPAALIAIALPLLVDGRRAPSRSEAFGLLYAANTGGSVVGSLLVGFVLLPCAGLAFSVSAMAITAIAAGGSLVLWSEAPAVENRARAAPWALAGAAVAVAALLAGKKAPLAVYEAYLPRGLTILDFQESTVSDVMVTEDTQNHRRLWINSAWVAGTGGGHRMLGLLPPLFVAEPRRGLGIALGTGQTFAAMFRSGLSTLDCVELNPSVIALSRRWFGDANDHLFEKPGVLVHLGDGRAFLRETNQRFDLVVLEPLQAWTAGTANLYTREFYQEAQRALTRGGVVAQWIPFYGQTEADTRAMVRAAADVFPTASLWLDESDGILILSNDPFVLDPETLAGRMRARGVDALLAQNDVTSVSDLLALFVMGPAGIHRWVSNAPIMDDDHPFLEFSAARNRRSPNRRDIVASARDGAEDAAAYFGPSALDVDGVARAARAVQQALLDADTLPANDHEAAAQALELAFAAAPTSELLSARYGREILGWAAASGKGGRQARDVYERALTHDPRQGEALLALARLCETSGRIDDARRFFLRAMDVPRVHRDAANALEEMRSGPR